MNDEINKIIQSISDFYKLDNALKYYLDRHKAQTLLDYITNLQQENKYLNNELNNMTDYAKDLQQENERLKEENNNKAMNDYAHAIDESWYRELYDDYKSRCEKAVEYIENGEILDTWGYYKPFKEFGYGKDLLNILQNGSEKE